MRTRDLSMPMDLYNYEVYQYKAKDLGAYCAYINDVESFVDGSLNVEGETSIDLRGDLARYYLQDFLAKFHKETVQCGVDLLFHGATLHTQSIPLLCILMVELRRISTDMVLAVSDGDVHQLGIFWLLRSS